MGEEAQFRNAALGGFNKEDVLRYIEMMKQSALETNMKLDQTPGSFRMRSGVFRC